MGGLILDRVACSQQFTRVGYTWWRYTIENDCISIYALKEKFPTLDDIFLGLLRDIDFIKNYIHPKYTFKNYGIAVGKDHPENNKYIIFAVPCNGKFEKENALIVRKRDFRLCYDVINFKIVNLLMIFATLYPKNMKRELKGTSFYMNLNLNGKDKKPKYRDSFNKCFHALKEMNFENKHEYVVTRYFAGFTKKSKDFDLFAYGECYRWTETDFQTGKTKYKMFEEKFSSNLRKFYIFFNKNGNKFEYGNSQRFAKRMEKLFIKDGYTFN